MSRGAAVRASLVLAVALACAHGVSAAAASPAVAAPVAAAAAASEPASEAAAAATEDPPDGPRVLTFEQAEKRWADARSRFADLDGIRVHYFDEGVRTGPVVLLVHGSYGDLTDWDGWVAGLRDRYRVVRFDRPGAGLTGPIANGNYSLDRQLALVDALMDSLGVERFAVVGASLGGPVAYRYAATRTQRVIAMVLVNSAGIEFGGRRGTTQAPPASAYGWATAPTIARADVRRTYEQILNDRSPITPEFVERKFQLYGIVGRDAEAVQTVKLYERGDPQRILARVRAPTLVQWGGANAALSTSTSEAFAKALQGAPLVRRIVYDGAGHMIHVERPEGTVRDARAFLDEQFAAAVPAAGIEATRAHWQRLAGAWVAEAAYLDGRLQPNVPQYGAVLRITSGPEGVVQREWKYYPASPLASSIAKSLAGEALAEDEGLTLVSEWRGRPVGPDGALDFGPEAGMSIATGDGAAIARVYDPAAAGGVPALRYRMLDTLSDDAHLVRTTLGFAPDGTLKGVSVFRYRRIDTAALDAERARLAREYRAVLEVDRTGTKPSVTRVGMGR